LDLENGEFFRLIRPYRPADESNLGKESLTRLINTQVGYQRLLAGGGDP
jgi:hypothetical protein